MTIRIFAPVFGVLTLLTAAGASAAEPALALHDGFETGNLMKGALMPCYRPENVLVDQQSVVRMGRWAARLSVYPRPAVVPANALTPEQAEKTPPPSSHSRPSPSCLDPVKPDNTFTYDETERAEMWEPKEIRLNWGTEVWYGFSMYMGPTVIQGDDRRLVSGQWKQSGGNSPFVAQRFDSGNFHVTIQQDAADGGECRVLVAYQSEPAPMPASNEGGKSVDTPCMQDLTVERFGYLPNPFESWTDMVYHIKGSAGSDGILEVFAGGKLIARARGRIGYRAGGTQYFKFGPYRDATPYSTTAYLDAFARGASYADVALGGSEPAATR